MGVAVILLVLELRYLRASVGEVIPSSLESGWLRQLTVWRRPPEDRHSDILVTP